MLQVKREQAAGSGGRGRMRRPLLSGKAKKQMLKEKRARKREQKNPKLPQRAAVQTSQAAQ